MRLFISLLFVYFLLKSAIVSADYEYAYCSLVPNSASTSFSGFVKIYKNELNNVVTFQYNLNALNLPDGLYGVSINRFGYPVSDLGGVYNPDNAEPGCPNLINGKEFRVGDLIDVNVTKGVYVNSVEYSLPQLSGDNSIIGRSLSFYRDSICPPTLIYNNNGSKEILATCVIGYANTTVPENLPTGFSGVNTASASTTESANGIAVLYATTSANGAVISGQVSFSKASNGVQILSGITGLTKEAHGFHIHAFGQLSDNGSALGGHWANSTQAHSLPTDNSNNRHFGDLGNICTFDAAFEHAYYNYSTNYFTLDVVFGRGFAVHATRDLGNTNVGGARILQGVIAMVDSSSAIPSNVSPSTNGFKFDNICPNGAVDGETGSSSSGSNGSSSSSSNSNGNSSSSTNSNSNSSSSSSSNSNGSSSESDGSSTSDNSSTKLISSLFILGIFSSLFVLLL